MLHPYVFLAVFLWFLFGVVVFLLFGETIWNAMKRFNAKYGELYAHHFRKGGQKGDPVKMARLMMWV
jgi:hypothetical protein